MLLFCVAYSLNWMHALAETITNENEWQNAICFLFNRTFIRIFYHSLRHPFRSLVGHTWFTLSVEVIFPIDWIYAYIITSPKFVVFAAAAFFFVRIHRSMSNISIQNHYRIVFWLNIKNHYVGNVVSSSWHCKPMWSEYQTSYSSQGTEGQRETCSTNHTILTI